MALIIETGKVEFVSTNLATATLIQSHKSTPSVIVSSVDSASNNEANTNIFINQATVSSIQFESAAQMTATVHFVAISTA